MPGRNGKGPRPKEGSGRNQGPIQPGAGPEGLCVCPACGHSEAHQRGLPCNHLKCAHCGVTMRRE